MGFRKRLIYANIISLVLPLLLTLAVGFLFVSTYNTFGKNKISYDNLERFAQIRLEVFSTSEAIWTQNPENLAKEEFAKYLSQKLKNINAKLVVLSGEDVLYSDFDFDKDNISLEDLTKNTQSSSFGNYFTSKNTDYISFSHSFNMSGKGQGQGQILVIVPVDDKYVSSYKFLWGLLLIFVVSFYLTNMIYSKRMYRYMVRPLERLKEAVARIGEGDFDQIIIEEGDEEIKSLIRSIDLMRIKLQDFTRSREKIESNRKMLVTSISHDLKTPLTIIMGYVDGILEGVAKDPPVRDNYLNTIKVKALQIDKMIDDLLLYSKLDLGQVDFELEETDIRAFVKDCIEENMQIMLNGGVDFSFEDLLGKDLSLKIDKLRFTRVIQNLLDNAVKYADSDNKMVGMKLRSTADSLIMEIYDNGPGIPKKHLPMIFDRFYRTDEARDTSGGSGLGLAIAKEIVLGHGGKIWAISGKGKGTRFMISLPYKV